MKKISLFIGVVVILGIAISSAISNAANRGYLSGGPSEGLIVPKLDLGRINAGSFAQKEEERTSVKGIVRPKREIPRREVPEIKLSADNRAIAAANRAIDALKRALANANEAIKSANRLGARMKELELREKPYVVVSGDSLWKIAKNIYGDASLWKKIFDANRDKIKDSNFIYPGQILNIP